MLLQARCFLLRWPQRCCGFGNCNSMCCSLHAAATGAVLVAALVGMLLWLRRYKRRVSEQQLLPVKGDPNEAAGAAVSSAGKGGLADTSADRSGLQKTRKSMKYVS
jgi:hypothetical protein